ncbi:MAG TPA: NB-ARC domain-containing protein, partial [Mycobacterium sp.]
LRRVGSSLVGRDAEIAEIKETLHSRRLVTLTGVGGVGKTRLALETASQLAYEFPDGVWVFELAAVADPAAVPDAVAAVLGITSQPDKTVSESVAAALEGRNRLLVFDNCEHVVDAAADLVEAILARSATVRILATSREGLGIAEERLWRVPSLDVGAAVELFVERAQSTVSGSMSDEAAAVEEVCRRLDGIPLAIELAASRMASMTAAEMRDRLDDRFKLLVGSRRGLERHQTLRHAVAWSYDLLDDDEKVLLERCSVFAGGFDLQSACAIAEFEAADEYVVLDLLDALVRKSLLVAARSPDRTRYSMLETIRQFAEDQLVARGDADEARTAHARYFAACGTDVLALWDGPRQREAYTWFATELANLRTAFRWAADRGDLDVAATIASYAGFLGYLLENYEPIAWAEEMVEPARAVDHPRLAFLYVSASCCWLYGRVEDAVRYTEAGQTMIASGRGEVPYGAEGWLGGAHLFAGQIQRWVEWCRAQISRGSDTALFRACLVLSLAMAGSMDEAITATKGLVDAAEATHNPHTLSFGLLACGFAFRDAEPKRAIETLRRGLVTAEDSGNRGNETHLLANLFRLEYVHGDPLDALDHVTSAIRNYHDSGDTATMRTPLAILAAFLDRRGYFEAAAMITGFALSSFAAAAFPEVNTAIAHLRDRLGDQVYESFAGKGAAMTTAAMVAYAYDQIDQARTELGRKP